MDANQTRYHLLLGRDDWANCLSEKRQMLDEHWHASPVMSNDSGLAWNVAKDELTLQPRLVEFKTSKYDDVLGFDRRRGAARDRYGNWYWIAESGIEIHVQSSGTGRSTHFWKAGDGDVHEARPHYGDFRSRDPLQPVTPLPLSGLAVTEDHYLVVGVLEPKGLLIFDLHATGAPRQLFWPAEIDFVPFDIAPRPGGGVWILDRLNRRYWGLDRKLNVIRLDAAAETVISADFQAIDQAGTRRHSTRPFPEAIILDMSSPVEARDPVAIDAVPDGSVLILDNVLEGGFSRLYRYLWKEQQGPVVSLSAALSVVEEESRAGFRLVGYDLAFVPAQESSQRRLLGKLFVAAMNGNQTFAFDVFGDATTLALQARAEYYPMRLFAGKAIVSAGDVVHYDFGESWLPLIQQKRPRYEFEATLFTSLDPQSAFDGKQPDCVWHRLMLDACIPPDSSVIVWSRTANELRLLGQAQWQREPGLYQRADGSELPFVPDPSARDAGTWEFLFQRARGRYLQLKIMLRGNGRSTPRLHALRAYYPRFSYLEHYLPAVYREDEGSAWFLDRFLANEEGTFTALEDKIANVQMLFDVRSAPAEALDWLAGWLGIVLDPAWDERRRRLFIRYAVEFFQYRGTIRGLLILLHLALDKCVDETIFTQPLTLDTRKTPKTPVQRLSAFRIVEDFRTRQTPPVILGDPTEAEGLRVVIPAARWDPKQGGDTLNQRWQEAEPPSKRKEFPIRDPGDIDSEVWRSFTRSVLGFLPSSDPLDDQAAWQSFLSNRYSTIDRLNTAYGLLKSNQYSSFDTILLPADLPSDGPPLLDWYEFEGTILPMRRAAHRFLVLLPASKQLSPAERQERLEIAERVINLEKPAHTIFRVKFYWAMFRVGEARLGEDSVVDLGSRAPDLMPPFMLGRDYLSQGYLVPGHPQNVDDRMVLDRDRLGSTC